MTFIDNTAKAVSAAKIDAGATTTACCKVPDLPSLPEPTVGFSDSVTAALASLAQLFKKTREHESAVKQALHKDQAAAEKAAANDLHEKADAIRSAGYVSAAFTGAAALGAVGSATGSDHTFSSKTTVGNTTNEFSDTSKSWLQRAGESASPVLLRSSEIAGRFGDAAATDHEADSDQAKARAEGVKGQVAQVSDEMKDQSDLIHKVMDTIKGINDARHAAIMGVLGQRW